MNGELQRKHYTNKSNRRTILTFVMTLVWAMTAFTLPAQSVTLAWNSATNPYVTGYVVYSGTDGINFKTQLNVGTNNPVTVSNLTEGATNYFEVVSYDAYSNVSPASASVNLFIPLPVVTNSLPVMTNSVQNNDTNSGGTNGSTNGGNGGGITGTNNGENTGTNNAPHVDVVLGTTIVTNTGTGFALLVNGNGTLTPSRTLKDLLMGKKYSLSAVPAKGFIFFDWTSNGTVVATTPAYTFLVQSNLMLQANFMTNPFPPAMGTYHGLFYVSTNISEASAGSIVASVTSAGMVNAKLTLGNQSHTVTGQFSSTGEFSKSVTRPGLTPLAVQLQLGLTNGLMTGTVSDGDWTAELVADLAVYAKTNPAPQVGKYTMAIPGGRDSNQPNGNGFGALTVSDLGAVTFSGTLGDGTTVTATSTVSSAGTWPLYISLYGGHGSMLGWLSFTNDAIVGQLAWFKLPTASKLYPGGFTNSSEVMGSAYHATNGVSVLDISSGTLFLTNGNLTQSINSQLLVESNNQATNASGDKVTFNPSTGLFKGDVMNPSTGKSVPVSGVVLQNQNIGAGLFLGTTETGTVVLSTAP